MGKRSNGTRSGGASEASAARTLSTSPIGNEKVSKAKETSFNTFTAPNGEKYEYGKKFSVSLENKIKADLTDMLNVNSKLGSIVDEGVKFDVRGKYSELKKKDEHLYEEYRQALKHPKVFGWEEIDARSAKLDGLITEPKLYIKATNNKNRYDAKERKTYRSAHENHYISVSYNEAFDHYNYKDTCVRYGKTGNRLGEKTIQKRLTKKQIISKLKKFTGDEWV